MSYHIDPKSEEELDIFGLLEDGVYDFEVIKSEDKVSSSGNPMNKVTLKIWEKDGSVRIMSDYLVFSPVAFCLRKIKHFCDAVGISDEYTSGKIRSDFMGLAGKVELKIKPGDLIPDDKLMGKPHGSKYPDKNEVKDYIVKSTNDGMKPLPEVKDEFNDDIPF